MTRGEKDDPFGRDFSTHPALSAPYYVAKVTGALFHTQGGLDVDLNGRVLREDGAPLPNCLPEVVQRADCRALLIGGIYLEAD